MQATMSSQVCLLYWTRSVTWRVCARYSAHSARVRQTRRWATRDPVETSFWQSVWSGSLLTSSGLVISAGGYLTRSVGACAIAAVPATRVMTAATFNMGASLERSPILSWTTSGRQE